MSATTPGTTAEHLLPLALYQANLALLLRTSALLAENRAQWVALGVQTLRGGIDETRGEANDLLKTADWQALAALPTHAFWQTWQRHAAAAQGVVQTAIGNQAAFGAGYRAALAEWRDTSAQAVERAWHRAGAAPAAAWQAAVPRAAAANQPTAGTVH